jgi:hypothetical protein
MDIMPICRPASGRKTAGDVLSRRVRMPKVTVSFIMSACLSTYIRATHTELIFVKLHIWNF